MARALFRFFLISHLSSEKRLGVAVWPAYRPQPAEHALLAAQVCQHVQEDGSVRCDLVDLVEVACSLRVVWPCGAVGGVCQRTLLSSVFRFTAPRQSPEAIRKACGIRWARCPASTCYPATGTCRALGFPPHLNTLDCSSSFYPAKYSGTRVWCVSEECLCARPL